MDGGEHVKMIIGRLWRIFPLDPFLACCQVVAGYDEMACFNTVDPVQHLD
jgi:hypothetical protein